MSEMLNASTGGSVPSANNSKGSDLSDRELIMWGIVGGLFFVAVNLGLFDLERIQQMLGKSEKPVVQAIGLAILSCATLAAGAAWVRVHKPLQSTLVALQLGIIAPLAITALIESFSPNRAKAPAVSISANQETMALASSTSRPASQSQPSTVKCFVKSLVKQAC
jgi:hypothetical protein